MSLSHEIEFGQRRESAWHWGLTMSSNEQTAGAWLETAKPARYMPHDERNAIELEKVFSADSNRFAGELSPPLDRLECDSPTLPVPGDMPGFSSEAFP